MSLISSLCTCTDEEFAFTERIFAAAGKVAVVEDHVYTPANGISGCGPAFVYAFIEAMADGGVRYGVRVRWLMNWLHKRLSAQQGWCLKPVNILAN